jgi:valyl-tRNA synthetase
LFAVFEAALRLLHPFMPFLTEELWHRLPQAAGARSISLQAFPQASQGARDAAAERDMALLQEIVVAARNARSDLKLDPKRKVAAEISVTAAGTRKLLEANLEPVLRLASLESLEITPGEGQRLDPAKGAVRSSPDFEICIPFGGGIDSKGDSKTEIARLRKEKERLARDVESKTKRLKDPAFRGKAPGEVVNNMENTLAERRIELQKLTERLTQLEASL